MFNKISNCLINHFIKIIVYDYYVIAVNFFSINTIRLIYDNLVLPNRCRIIKTRYSI